MSRMRLLAAAALLALCACATADPAATAVEARQRACRAALGVLRRCAFSSSTHEDLRTRCCSLLDTFTSNGCLCPSGSDCEGSDLSSSPAGMQLSVQLAPIMELCAPTPASNAIESAALPAVEEEEALTIEVAAEEATQAYDEDDAMADMAGLAAAAQDPRTPGAEQPSSRPLPPEDVAPLMDTPTDDYDNWLTDADAAFMLVDPAAASSYASRAEAVLSMASDAVAADVAVLRGEAAGVANAAEGRLQHLLASLDMSLEELEQKLAAVAASGRTIPEADPEEVASAAAVSDDSSLTASRAADPQLAPADAVPQTAEQRRAAALAAALERMQERNLANQQDSQLAVDVTMENGNEESARHLADSVLTLLKSWQASDYSSNTQAELAAALQATAQRVVASASLGRSGLQPKQLLQQVEERRWQRASFGGSDEPHACTCMSVQFDENDELYDDLATALRRRYISVRLALCRFACTHQHTLAFLLVAELALCLAWLLVWAVRGSILPSSSNDCDSPTHVTRGCPQESQFVVASAADPQWQAEMQQPLLETRGSATDSC